MKVKKQYFLKLALFMCMLFGLLSVSASAATIYTSSNGLFKFTLSNSQATITSYTAGSTTLNIPSTVTYSGKTYTVVGIGDGSKTIINSNAISDVKNVVIPASVKYINPYAFSGCTGIQSVTFGANITQIGESAFQKCTSLTSVVLGKNVQSIGNKAFLGCTALTSVKCSTASYPTTNYLKLTSFNNYFPAGLTTLGANAFYNCTALSGSLYIPARLQTVSSQAFYSCTSLTAIYVANGVKQLDSLCFGKCSALKKIFVPKSVTKITNASDSNGASFAGSIISKQTVVTLFADSAMDTYMQSIYYNPTTYNYLEGNENPVQSGSMKITASGNTTTLWAGQTLTLALSYSPATSGLETSDNITWKTYNSNLVISEQGINFAKVTSSIPGNGYMIKAVANSTADAEYTLNVKAAPTSVVVAEKGKTVATSTHTVDISGGSKTLSLLYKTSPTNGAPVTWSSSNTSIATVDSNGVVTCKAEGTVNIIVKTYNGKTATYQITSSIKRATNTTWKEKGVKLNIGKTYKFTESISGKKLSSSDTSVATVSPTGVITAKKAGYALISIYDSKTIAKCLVVVLPKKQKITSATVDGKLVTLKWNKQVGVTGYQVQYSTKKSSGYKSIQKTRSQKQNYYKFTTLKENKTYYFKVRSYVTVNNKRYYGAFSGYKKVKTKSATTSK